MRPLRVALALSLCLLCCMARADDTVISLAGEVPSDPLTHFFLPFEVPEGTAEIQIDHDVCPTPTFSTGVSTIRTAFAAGAAATPSRRSSASTQRRAATCPARFPPGNGRS